MTDAALTRLTVQATNGTIEQTATIPGVTLTLDRWLRGLRPQAWTRLTLTDKGAVRAAVERARTQGFAYVEQELQEGLCSLAVPVRDARGQIIAALNSGMPFRLEARTHALKKVLPALRSGARTIERSLLAGGVTAAARA